MKINFSQKSTQRGFFKLISVVVSAIYFWHTGDATKAGGALALSTTIMAYLGIADDV